MFSSCVQLDGLPAKVEQYPVLTELLFVIVNQIAMTEVTKRHHMRSVMLKYWHSVQAEQWVSHL